MPNKKFILFGIHKGDPDRIRTCDPQIRNLLLYPAELWDRPSNKLEKNLVNLKTNLKMNFQIYTFSN